MTEDQFEKRCAEFDKRLEEMRALLTVAYNGAGAINANASHVVDKVNEIAHSVHGLTEGVDKVNEIAHSVHGLTETVRVLNIRVAGLQEKVDTTHLIAKAVAQSILSPEELRSLGLPALMPALPVAKRA